MAQQIAQVATAFHPQQTGHKPKSVSGMLGGDTLVVTLHGALSSAEQAMAQTSAGADKVQEFHRALFRNSSETLRQEIKRITEMEVRESGAAKARFTDHYIPHIQSAGIGISYFTLQYVQTASIHA